MGKTTLAVDTLERLAVQLTGIQEAAAQLREIGSYQDAIADLTKQRDGLLKEVDAAQQQQKACMDKSSKVLADAQGTVERMHAEAATIVADANTRAANIIKEASEQAAMDLQADKANREAALKTLQKQVEAEKKTLKELQDTTAQAVKEADAIERRVAAAQQDLEGIQAKARALSGL